MKNLPTPGVAYYKMQPL